MPFPIITIILATVVFIFTQNIYLHMIAYLFLACQLTLFIFSKNLIAGPIALIVFCLCAPFPLAYKFFFFGITLGVMNSGLHGRQKGNIDTVAGIATLTGIVLGVYNFFAH